MDETVKEKIKKSGLKQKYLAETLGVSENFFSMCMNGRRNLSKKRHEKLKELV